ncbi:MAG: L-ribulose-5-phosphate 3-epimerase [Spirochaetaceae bacterium]|nr:MAG: L-ribulose-5-phosphate 3-epimerase [Spirochaetaceae bacterium]
MHDLTLNKLGIYEKALPPFSSWNDALEITRRCGYDFLEISIDESTERLARLSWGRSEISQLRTAITETGVPVRTLCLSGHRKFPFASEDVLTQERAWEMLRQALNLCGELGIPIIQTPGHDVYYEPSTDSTWKRYEDALQRASEMCRDASVMLGLENADKPCVGSLDQARALVTRTGNPWFQLYPDIGNVVAHGYEIGPEIERAYQHFVSVHIKDARPGEFRRVPFGEGTVPFRDAFAALRNVRYGGPFVIEMWNESSDDPEGVIRTAREWVRRQMAP